MTGADPAGTFAAESLRNTLYQYLLMYIKDHEQQYCINAVSAAMIPRSDLPGYMLCTTFHGEAWGFVGSADDPTAKALEYTEHSTQEGQSCANCNLYQGGTAASGPCFIFPGKGVAAAGWC